MKKLVLILLSVLMVFSLASCKKRIEPTPTNNGTLVVSDQKSRFTIEIPDTWIQLVETGDIVLHVTAPEQDKAFTTQVTVSIQAADDNLYSTEKEEFQTAYRLTIPDVEITEFKTTTMAGEKAIYLVAEYNTSNHDYIMRQYIFNSGANCFYISMTSAAEFDAQYQEDFNTILESFKVS